MDIIPLNFATFYYCVVKNNTRLRQYDAVAILLVGKNREDCATEISDQIAAHYISGRKPVRRQLIRDLHKEDMSEITRRLQLLNIQDAAQTVIRVGRFLQKVNTLSNGAKNDLLAKTALLEPYPFLAELFMTAVKCPAKDTLYLSREDKRYLNSILDGTSEETDEAVKEDMDASENGQKKPKLGPTDRDNYSNRATEDFNRSFQKDRTCTVCFEKYSEIDESSDVFNYLCHILEDNRALINLDMADVMSIISKPSEGTYFDLIEIDGPINLYCRLTEQFSMVSRCSSLLMYIFGASDFELSDMQEIIDHTNDAIGSKDVNSIFGVEFEEERRSGTAHIIILSRTDISNKTPPSNEQYEPKSEEKPMNAQPDDDIDEIFKIFERQGKRQAEKGTHPSSQVSNPEIDKMYEEIFRIFNRQN